MIFRYGLYLLAVIVLSIISNILSIWMAKKLNFLDIPGSAAHKKHSRPTPISGGISVVITFSIYIIFSKGWENEKWIGILIGAIIIFMFGLWDDVFKFAYSTKLMGQLMGGMVLIASGTSFELFANSDLFFLNWIVTLLWVVGIVNAFNFIDSMDNIVIGLSIICFASLTFFFFNNQNGFLTEISLVLTGISFVSFFFNRTPAKMFLGDSGAQTLGYLFATICILFSEKVSFEVSPFFPLILIAGVPIFNITLVVFSRIRRGIPVYKANLDQIYHRLVKIGLKEKIAVLIIHTVSLTLSGCAILMIYLQANLALALFFAILIVGLIVIFILDDKKIWI